MLSQQERAAINRMNALAHSGSVVRDQVKPSTGPKSAEVSSICHLTNLSMYAQRYHKLFERSHNRLMLLQDKRRQKEYYEMFHAAELLALHEYEQQEAREEHEAEQAAAVAEAQKAGTESP